MIVRRTWERGHIKRDPLDGFGRHVTYRDIYTGWFLLGIIPLFIRRDRSRL